jgi:2-(1,2-epoxy-1,2-dihydrophenyl)acetyl-CoA isomerase
MSDLILLEVKNKVATLTLNRPEQGNAFARESYGEVINALQELGRDDSVGSIVVTGAGKNFSAGGDIKRFKMMIDTKEYLQAESILLAGAMAMEVRKCPKPVVAMINGAAAGAGAGLALACDFRFATAKSKIILAFINMGLAGDTGSLYALTRLIGTGKAIEIMALGDPVGGEEAYRLNLVTKLCEPEKLEEETLAFAQRLANKPTFALSRQKRLLLETFYSEEAMTAYHKRESVYMAECSRSADFAEAVNAFLEKRAAVFQGK